LSFFPFFKFVLYYQNACQIIKPGSVCQFVRLSSFQQLTSSAPFLLSLRRGKNNKKDNIVSSCIAGSFLQVCYIPLSEAVMPPHTYLLAVYA
jgi:hypothetical protein